MLMKDFLKTQIRLVLISLYPESKQLLKGLDFEVSDTDFNFGDYTTNVAFNLAKILKKNPNVLAEELASKMQSISRINHCCDKIEALKGYVNFWLKLEYLDRNLDWLVKVKRFFPANHKTMVIDYSSPNIAKPFGIGHFRSTNIGGAIYNIYKFLGYKTISDNHLGDWGKYFGILIYQLESKVLKNKTSKERQDYLKKMTVSDLEKIYVDFHKEVENNPLLDEQARMWFKKLSDGNLTAKKIWQACIKVSLKEFNRIYKILGVKFDYSLGESFYKDMMLQVISEIKKKKLAQESQGALVVSFSDKDMPPGMLLKSDGATTYLTSDLAALKYRLKNFKPNLVIYEVGKEQDLHFKQLFKIAEMLGWLKNCELIHVAHGLFESSDGGKLSTRSGKTIYLEDVLEEAYKRTQSMISESDIKKSKIIVGKVALGALKYNDLSQHYSHNIIFDWNKILNLNGNSGPYLQYSYARAYNVLIKSKTNTKIKIKDISLDEKKILRKLSKFKEVVIEAGARFSPHILCLYLFELAQLYNNFYNNYPILKAETFKKQAMRLKITKGTANIIKIGLNLLGVETLSRM